MFRGILSPAGGYLLPSQGPYRVFTKSNHSHVIQVIYHVLELNVLCSRSADGSVGFELHLYATCPVACFFAKLPCLDFSDISTDFSGPC